MRANETMWIFTISVLLHILLSSGAHLRSHHEWQSPYDFSVKRKFVIKDFILREGGNKNNKIVVIGRCALVFCLSWSESFVVSLRHPIDLVSGDIPSTYHMRSSRDFFLIYMLHLLEVIIVTVLSNTLNSERWIMNLGYVSLALFLVSGAMYILYFTVLKPDKASKILSVSNNPRLQQFGYKTQVYINDRFCHKTEKAIKINGTQVYSSAQYNRRLQVLDPCYACMLDREHTNKYKPVSQSKCCSLSCFLKKVRNCFTRPFNSTFTRLSPSITDAENLKLRRKDVDFLITKVRKYEHIRIHLFLFPGIENIAKKDPKLISRCRAVGLNVFRSITEIRDDDLSPNLVPACNKLKERIENKYIDVTTGETLNDELFEQISNLCKEYFSLKEQQWESKVLAWCETAPTEILAKHDYRKWDSPQCIKDIQKWLKEKERLAVYLNPCNKNAPNKSDTTVDILLYDEKHSNFHINGVKKPSKHGWVTRKFEELRNRYHRNKKNYLSGQTEYQPVGQDIVTIETGQDIVNSTVCLFI